MNVFVLGIESRPELVVRGGTAGGWVGEADAKNEYRFDSFADDLKVVGESVHLSTERELKLTLLDQGASQRFCDFSCTQFSATQQLT